MKSLYFNIIIVFLWLLPGRALSQTGCTVPISPVLTSVSVQPESGNTELKWTLSPSTGIAAYVVYTYKDGTGMPIDTIWDPAAKSFIFASTATKYFSVSYVVAAHRTPDCTSPLSNAITSIFCNSEIDTCKKEIKINWNSYTEFPARVMEYKVLVSVNGAPLAEMFSVDRTMNSYTLTNFTTDSQYCFAIKAVLEGGSISTSNKSCVVTKMQRPPAWINADFATVNPENKINLSFSIDPLSEIKLFSLERKTGQAGIYQSIAQLTSANNKILYSDNQSDAKTINYFRLSAVNNCNLPVIVSNISSNMVLVLERSGNDLNLTWNGYNKWLGQVELYKVFMDTGNGFSEKTVVSAADSSITLAYQDIMYEVSGNELCFYVSGSESANPHGINGESLSNRVCTTPTEIVTVPNVFTPNNDLVNDFFRPVLSFTPPEYHLVISDRQGKTLFETRNYNEEWDGKHNGDPQPQGVCLWFLRVTTPSGKSISRTGTITLITDRQ